MKWITTTRPGLCFDCCSSVWSGASALLRERILFCSPCGRALERRLKERERLARGAVAHGKATQELGE